MRKFDAESARRYKTAMEADGWTFTNTYNNDNEYFSGKKDGYKCSVNCRMDKRFDFENDFDSTYRRISVWRPDGLAVEPPYEYDWNTIKLNENKCDFCGKVVDKVVRVGFANKSCKECESAARKKIEFPGWTN